MEKQPIKLPFPSGGINRRFAYSTQPELTTPDALNVWPQSIDGQRYRGGTRPGFEKAWAQQIGSANPVNMLEYVSWANSGVLTHQLYAACNGAVYRDVAGTMTSVASGALGTSYTQGTDIGQKLYLADYSNTGGTVKVVDPSANTIGPLVATEGSVPTFCKLIARFRGRLVLAGDKNDPHMWYMSRVGDAADWDYSIEDDTAAAVSGALSDAYKLGEAITALIPSRDMCMVFGCSNSMWLLRSDPAFGGQIDALSHTVGVIDQAAWTKTPDGIIIFLSHDGLYMTYGGCDTSSVPQSLSKERIPEELIGINITTTLPILEYDAKHRGVHIWLTPRTGATQGTHWYFDWETKGFWKVKVPGSMQPKSMRAGRGVTSSDSSVWMGGNDGYIRKYDLDATSDDGTAYESYVDIGPFGQGEGFVYTCLDELHGYLAAGSSKMYWNVRTGATPEEAYNADLSDRSVSREGEWTEPGFNYREHPRLTGSDFYLRVGSLSEQWALERIGATLSTRGKLRG